MLHMHIFRFFVTSLSLLSSPALAGDLDLKIVDAAGKAVSDAVITVRPAGGVPSEPIRFPWGTSMVQQNIAFVPHVLIVPVGATVRFPNKDKVRHHIYSFSKPAKFEIKLFGQDESRSYTFTSAGAVALGCNIHDQMSGFIKVVDTPFATKSNAAGQAHLGGLATGTAKMTVWHPLLKAKDNELVINVPIPPRGSATKTITLALRSAG
ncbi:methylamine utilization protein [Sphingobium sp. BS19]|uniref:cupredoxin domain-containing protein n=1 Tax=Sphingobium sp. BS19 TaxID=3018973 RepID=UPI002493782F|nr:methylamine utilization protein [Sphingobium sp. BS19]